MPGTAITIETDAKPSLIAYRDGAGGWKPAKMIDVDTFELDVHGPYIVTVACDDGDGITTWQVARTPDDDRELFLPCFATITEPFALTGTMTQAGAVSAGFATDRSTTANWAFDLPADAGATDVVAFDANRILRRGITVTGDTQITPALDLNQGGTMLVATPLVAPNATATETVSATISITTSKSTFAPLFRGAAAQTKVAPSSFFGPGERQSAAVTAREGLGSRALRRASFRAGDSTDFTLPASLGAVSYAQPGTSLQVTWSTLPEHDIVDVTVDAFSDDFATYFFHDLEISPAYIAATGATSMTLDTDIPGYKPAWRIDYAKEYFRTVSAFDFRASETATSSISENVNAPPALVRSVPRRSPAIERALARRDVLRQRVRGG